MYLGKHGLAKCVNSLVKYKYETKTSKTKSYIKQWNIGIKLDAQRNVAERKKAI